MEELLPLLIRFGPAALGGITSGAQAISQGKSPLDVLGATAVGAGLGELGGRLGGGVGRFAGTKIAGLGAEAGLATAEQAAKMRGADILGKTLGVGVTGLAGAFTPALASGISSAVTTPAKAVAGITGNVALQKLVGAQQTISPYQDKQPVPPGIAGPYGTGQVPQTAQTLADVLRLDRPFQAGLEAQRQLQDVVARGTQQQTNIQRQAFEDEAKANMLRAVTMGGINANLYTQNQMLLNAQQSAQQMGQDTVRGMSSILANAPRYI